MPRSCETLEKGVGSRRAGGVEYPALTALRAAILHGELVAGQRLVEMDLAAKLGTSRNSIRLALLALADEGLVERVRNRGARVRVVTLEEGLYATEARAVLEGLCAARAAENATADDIRGLREIAGQMRSAVERSELVRYSDLNRTLHGRVRAIAAQPVASELLRRLRGQSEVAHQFHLALQPGRPLVSLAEHNRIVEAIASGDATGSETAMREHLFSVQRAIRDAVDQPTALARTAGRFAL